MRAGKTISVTSRVLVAVVVLAATPVAADWDEGLQLYYQGRYAEAAEHFRAATTTNPSWPGGYLMLGRCQLAMDELDDAIANLQKAVELKPTDPANVTALGRSLLAADRGAEARELLEGLDPEALSPEWKAEVALLTARTLLDEERSAEAVAILEARLADDPDRASLHQAIAGALMTVGNRSAALDHFARAFELDPEDRASGRAAVSIALSMAHSEDSKEREAAWYGRALEIAEPLATAVPDYDHTLLAGEAALGARRLETARGWFAKAVQQGPQEPLARYYLGRTLAALDRDDEAVTQLREALGAAPDGELAVRIHDQLGRLLACRLELAEAARHYRSAGDGARADQIEELATQFEEALARLSQLRSTVAELSAMEAELEELGDADGVEAVSGRRRAMGRDIAEIESNLSEVRAALCR